MERDEVIDAGNEMAQLVFLVLDFKHPLSDDTKKALACAYEKWVRVTEK